MQEFTHKFVVDKFVSGKVSIHAFYTMGVFLVPKDIYKILCNIGYDLKSVNGSGTNTLLPGLVLIESSSIITKNIPNIGVRGNITVKEHSNDVNNVMTTSAVKGFPGTVPAQPFQWVSAGNNVTSQSTNPEATVLVTPEKTYIVCIYLGVVQTLEVVINFDKYVNSIQFLS